MPDLDWRLERRFLAYASLAAVALSALQQAEHSAEKGDAQECFDHCTVSMVFCAFSLEAYLNYLGQEKLRCWSDVERKLSPWDKLQILAETMGYEVDSCARPFASFKEIFSFRSAIVHAKAEQKVLTQKDDVAKEYIQTKSELKWDRMAETRTARRFFQDTITMISQLNETGFGKPPSWSRSTVHYTSSLSTQPGQRCGDGDEQSAGLPNRECARQ